jgi:hypothetical protein
MEKWKKNQSSSRTGSFGGRKTEGGSSPVPVTGSLTCVPSQNGGREEYLHPQRLTVDKKISNF